MFHFLLWLLGGFAVLVYAFGFVVLTVEGLLFDEPLKSALKNAVIWPYYAIWPDIKRPLSEIWHRIRSFFA